SQVSKSVFIDDERPKRDRRQRTDGVRKKSGWDSTEVSKRPGRIRRAGATVRDLDALRDQGRTHAKHMRNRRLWALSGPEPNPGPFEAAAKQVCAARPGGPSPRGPALRAEESGPEGHGFRFADVRRFIHSVSR